MNPPILNIAELEYRPWGHGEKFEAKIGAVASKIGGEKLGYNVTVLPPGKRAFPFHSHRANEEMFFIIEGEGEVRIGDSRFPIRRGDVVACPTGGAERAHQILNTSKADLTYLAVSTRITPDIAEYPDSNKVGALTEVTGPDGTTRGQRFIMRGEASFEDYWDGE